jgi:HEAT repeat protein
LLRDPDPAVESAAIEAVVGRGAAEIDEIRDWLRHGNRAVIVPSLQAVIALGPSAVDLLPELEDLLDQESSLQPLVAEAIGSMQAAARPLVGKLMQRADELTLVDRLVVGRAMLEIGAEPEQVVRILDPVLADPASNVSREAARLVIEVAPAEARRRVSRLTKELAADGMSPRPAALHELGALGCNGADVVSHLVRLLAHPDADIQIMAIQALARTGLDAEPAIPILLSFLQARGVNPRIKVEVIAALGSIGPPARPAVPFLLRIVANPSPHGLYRARDGAPGRNMVNFAISALARIGDNSPEVLSALSRLLTVDTSSTPSGDLAYLRVTAMSALVMLHRTSVTTTAIVDRLLEQPYSIVRAQAALAIVQLPSRQDDLVSQLERMLDDPDPVVQSAVALAIGSLGSNAATAVPALRRLAHDPRNIVPNRFRIHAGWPQLNFVPGDADLVRLSVAAAARSALTAIESAGDPPRPDQKSDGR